MFRIAIIALLMSCFFPSPAGSGLPGQTTNLVAIVAVIAAHGAILAFLAASMPAEHLADIVRPLTVRFIEAKPTALSAPPPEPRLQPRPKVVPARLVAVTAPASAPAAFTVPPEPAPAPVAVLPAPSFSAELAPPAEPLVQPRFDASYLNNPKPHYPAVSRRMGEEGRVVLRVHVDAGGQVAAIEIQESSRFPRLDAAAREAVAQWRFVPARRGDQSVSAWVRVPIVFSLEG